MIRLEYEESFEVIVHEFKTFKEKDNWFKDNPNIWEKCFSLIEVE